MYRIGFDVGGTFTDFTIVDDEINSVRYFKVPSTPADPSDAIEAGIQQFIDTLSLDPKAITRLGHGTTVATNLVIERKGARTGLITTRGFRDVLEIGRQTRPHLYNYDIQRPAPLVPRELRFEVDERILADGSIAVPLNGDQVAEAARRLQQAGVDAVVICFLHSYRRPDHERLARDIVARLLPGAYISLSSDVLPEFREFERLSTTVVNAFVGPRMGSYLDRLLARVQNLGIEAETDTIHSNGGLMSVRTVREVPVRTCVSGPAAGVIGAAEIGRATGMADLITFDVGGTSTDVSIVVQGRPIFASDRLVADYTVKTPMIDIQVIGAGGGSIAVVDDANALKVGPQSAGAVPGPVAYGLGGDQPTITDANIILGRLDPVALLDGRLPVDAEAARAAITSRIASPLGLSAEDAALGIIRVANANMSRAIRSVSTERGHDIRNFALFAYGGAGPLHAAELAADCAIGSVVVPVEPGTLCARGILLSDVSMDFVRTELTFISPASWARSCDTLRALRNAADAWLEREKVAPADRELLLMIDARYDGQNYEVIVPLQRIDADGLDEFVGRFRRQHLQEYGYDVDDRQVEIVNCRVKAVGHVPKMRHEPPSPAPGLQALKGRRPVYFGNRVGWIETGVYRREQLPPGSSLEGPVVIEEMSSTTLVLPGQTVAVDRIGNLIITIPAMEPRHDR